jgi:hypothetical protein
MKKVYLTFAEGKLPGKPILRSREGPHGRQRPDLPQAILPRR